jgi:hypothetical protein
VSRRRRAAAWLLLPLLAAAAPVSGTLSFVRGADRPEDLVAIPGTRWLIASGFSDGAGLKLVDTERKTARFWYTAAPAQIQPEAGDAPHCGAPPDPATFKTRGLDLRPTGPNRYRLHVVNHGGRESIEIFDIDAGTDVPTLHWAGCLAMPRGQVGNAVATFADGTVLATVLTRPGTTIADYLRGRRTGAVYRWKPGGQDPALLPGTELPGDNGLATSPDQRHFFVVAFGWRAVVIFDRRDTRHPVKRIVAPDFMPDNVHWTSGRLVAAGMRYDEPACGGTRKIIDGVADPMLCHRGYVVAAVDPAAGVMHDIAYGEPDPEFSGVSTAVIANHTLWLGSFQADRIAYRPLPRPAASR